MTEATVPRFEGVPVGVKRSRGRRLLSKTADVDLMAVKAVDAGRITAKTADVGRITAKTYYVSRVTPIYSASIVASAAAGAVSEVSAPVALHEIAQGINADRFYISFEDDWVREAEGTPDVSRVVLSHDWPSAGRAPSVALPASERVVSHAPIMRLGGLAALALVLACVPLMLLSTGVALATLFLGVAALSLANYAAYRMGEEGWWLGPAVASRLFAGSVALVMVAVVATIAS